MSDNYDPVLLPVTQPGNVGDGLGSVVTRQAGLPPEPGIAIDPTPLREIIQPAPIGDGLGSPVIRNPSNGGSFFGGDGVFHADRPADDGTVYVDGVFADVMAPGIERTAMSLPPRAAGFGDMAVAQQRAAIKAQAEALGFVVSDAPGMPPVAGVIASDEGAHDPRDRSKGPQILKADKLPVIVKRAVVPLVLPTKVRRTSRRAAGSKTPLKAKAGR